MGGYFYKSTICDFVLIVLFTLSPIILAKPIVPTKLQPGDTVGLVSPSYKVSKQQCQDAAQRLEALGFKVLVPETALDCYGCYAGSWEARAEEINKMFANPEVKGIFAIRGGAGSSHVLDKLDYELIKENPKVFVGYSDITALLNTITHKTGLVTFHGPMPAFKMPSFSVNYLTKVVMDGDATIFENEVEEDEDDLINTKNRTTTINSGKCVGRLMGGNLTVLSTLMGNSYLPNDWKGTILFLEDVGEGVYSIDRALSQLRHAGILSQISGLVFGTCIDCEVGCKGSVTLEETLSRYLAGRNIPVFCGAMIGHQDKVFTVPLGTRVEMDADLGIIKMLEPAVS